MSVECGGITLKDGKPCTRLVADEKMMGRCGKKHRIETPAQKRRQAKGVETTAHELVNADNPWDKDFDLSNTSLTTFSMCPAQWKHKYVNKTPAVSQDNSRDIGILVHEAADRLHKLSPEDRHKYADRAIESVLDEHAHGSEIDPDFADKTRKMWGKLLELRDPAEVKGVSEVKVQGAIRNVPLVGHIDMLAENEDGTYTIEDIKTGRSPNPVKDQDDEENWSGIIANHKVRQFMIYADLAEQQHGIKVSSVRAVYPDSNDVIEISLGDGLGQAYREEARNYVEGTAAGLSIAIDHDDFPVDPSEKKCSTCDYSHACEASKSKNKKSEEAAA